MQIQRSAEHRVVPWANGLGITADVFLWPPDVAEWTWRLSIADVTDDVPFSVMPGIDRHIVVAQGAGMALTIDGAPEVRMDGATPPLSFDGESVTTCRLLDGPIADLNLMVRRGGHVGSLRVERLAMGRSLTIASDDVALVVLRGSLRAGGEELQTFDAVLLSACDDVSFTAASAAVCAVASIRSI
jgi:environmental stress-induced protein Ves